MAVLVAAAVDAAALAVAAVALHVAAWPVAAAVESSADSVDSAGFESHVAGLPAWRLLAIEGLAVGAVDLEAQDHHVAVAWS